MFPELIGLTLLVIIVIFAIKGVKKSQRKESGYDDFILEDYKKKMDKDEKHLTQQKEKEEKLNKILDKINKEGLCSLSGEEKRFLDRNSK